jgi:predicted phosphodiesterase
MRVAVLSDIHGNLPALEAVLAEVEAAAPDLIVLNGDLADGPFPAETLDVLMGLGDRATWVRGNGDRWVTEAYDGTFERTGGPADDLVEWTATKLSRAHRDRLAALSLTTSVEIPGLGDVAFCHASARSDNEMVLVTSDVDHLREALGPLPQETVVAGHCHMPFDRLFDRRRIVNAGAVGMPYGHVGASWALLGPDVVLRRTMYDLDAAAARIARSGMPDAEGFVRENVCTTPSDAEALEVFGKLLREQQDSGMFASTSGD